MRSESEDGGGDDDTEMGAADQARAAGGDHTSDSFLGANADADHVESDQHDDDGVGEESGRPFRALFLAVGVAVRSIVLHDICSFLVVRPGFAAADIVGY